MPGGLIAVDEIFVGREIEIAFLRNHLEEALKGIAGKIFIEGAAGVGKTALLDTFLNRVGHHRVLRASGAELEAGLPYGVVEQLLAETGQRPTEPLTGLGTDRAANVHPLCVGGAL